MNEGHSQSDLEEDGDGMFYCNQVHMKQTINRSPTFVQFHFCIQCKRLVIKQWDSSAAQSQMVGHWTWNLSHFV